jgi:hypothetical protein
VSRGSASRARCWGTAAARARLGLRSLPCYHRRVAEPIDVMPLVHLQAALWLPVLRTLRARLGGDAAAEIVEAALEEWRQDEAVRLYQSIPGRGAQRWLAGQRALGPRLAGAVEYRTLEQSAEHVVFEVTRCDIARYFRSVGEAELGFGLWCALDTTIAERIGEGAVRLHRRGTLMQGASVCDFHYAFPAGIPGASAVGDIGPASALESHR